MIDIEYDLIKSNLYKKYCNDYIFHYTSPEGLKGILESNSLHFTNIYFLNDKSEILHTYNLLQNLLPTLKETIDDELFKVLNNRASYILCSDYLSHETNVIGREDFYVASFSADEDNLALWSNYTKTPDKTGFNLKFNFARLERAIKSFSNLINRKTFIVTSMVNYNEEEQKNELTKCIKRHNELLNTEGNTSINVQTSLLYNLILYSLFFKNPKFKIENEIRIVVGNMGDIEDKNLEFKIKNGLFVPYIPYKLPKIKNTSDGVIEGITISSTANKQMIEYSLKRLCGKYGYRSMNNFFKFSEIPLRF